MDTVESLENLYREYAAFAGGLPRVSTLQKILQGVNSESDHHPCHQAFYDDVEAWVLRFCEGEPPQQERLRALEVILLTAADYKMQPAYWFMIAAQRHALALIPGLDAQNRAALGERYRKCYPLNTQLPVQQEVEALLRGPRARGFFRRRF